MQPTTTEQGSGGEAGMADRGREAANEAKQQAQQVASTAAEKGQEVAGMAGDKGREVAEAAKGQAMELGQQAATQARHIVTDAKQQVQGQAKVQVEQIAEGLRGIEGQLRAMVEGRTDEAGALRDYAGQAAAQLRRVADRAEQGGVDGLVQDLQRFGRNRPGAFLAAAAAAGFATARLWRSGAVQQAAQSTNGTMSRGEIDLAGSESPSSLTGGSGSMSSPTGGSGSMSSPTGGSGSMSSPTGGSGSVSSPTGGSGSTSPDYGAPSVSPQTSFEPSHSSSDPSQR